MQIYKQFNIIIIIIIISLVKLKTPTVKKECNLKDHLWLEYAI